MDRFGFGGDVIRLTDGEDTKDNFVPVLYKAPASTVPVPSSLKYLRPLALKSTTPESEIIRQRNITLFRNRISLVGELDPSRVLKCLAYRFGDKPFALMVQTEADPLSRLVSHGLLNPVEKLEVLWRAGKAIEHLHTRVPPVAHGGILPKAFLVTKTREVLLADFGYALVWRSLQQDPSLHQGLEVTSFTIPKVGYSAPETITGTQSGLECPADIFAFASTILAVTSNVHPYAGLNPWSPKGMGVLLEGTPPNPASHRDLPETNSLGEMTVAMGGRLELLAEALPISESSLEDPLEVQNLVPRELKGALTRDPDFTHVQGRFADVCKGYWYQNGEVRIVAIKYLRSTNQNGGIDSRNRNLQREAETWAKLRHPNIIELFGYVETPEPALVAPWCANGTLLEYTAHNLPPQSHILELLIQVSSAVQYLHRQQPPIFHGDVKPSNVLIADDGQALLSDFGSSVTKDSSIQDDEVTNQIGTNGYRAPEVLKPSQQSPAADVYSIACLILHILSGCPPRVPFEQVQQGATPQATEHLGLPASDPLWGLLIQCWSLDPQTRPKVESIMNELEAERILRSSMEIDIDLTSNVGPKHGLFEPSPVSVGLANELPRGSITTSKRVAAGYFADVYEGVLKGAEGSETPVAVKVLREVGMGSSRTPQERNERLNKVISAAKGLQYLHSLDPPICHADIKPANVLVSDDGKNALLSDFGLAASLTTLRSPHATSGYPQGTVRYQAPELFLESRRTLAGDVYSFACLILAVMSGDPPFYELPEHQVSTALFQKRIPDPANHPSLQKNDALWGLIMRCLSYFERDRPTMTKVVKVASLLASIGVRSNINHEIPV
ncbi:hypothetical protein FRC04_003181 [Tulasnella sp. 424]|nr:hypothetical protein FRC04_003181 [Tulasnella sp. 424]